MSKHSDFDKLSENAKGIIKSLLPLSGYSSGSVIDHAVADDSDIEKPAPTPLSREPIDPKR